MADQQERPDVAAFLAYANALPGPRMHEAGAVAARKMYLAAGTIADLPIGEIATIRDLAIPAADGPIAARLFDARETRPPGPALVFFHGGGFVIGDLDSHASLCAEFARVLDLPVIAIDYRLAPEHPWPAATVDAEAAARWIAGASDELDRTITALALCGDSAGGNLAIVTARALRDAPAAVPVIAQLLLYPATDQAGDYPSYGMFSEGRILTAEAMTWFAQSYAADAAHPDASPIAHDLAGMPPAIVMTAGCDPIRDQGRTYAARLAEAGVPVIFREAVGNVHGFLTLRRAIPSGVGDVAAFLAAARPLLAETEAARVAAQAAGEAR